MGPFKALTSWAFYFAPSLIAWYRTRHGKPVIGSVMGLFLFNLFLGWTGVVWILTLANAFGYNPVAWLVPRLIKVLPSGPGGNGSAPQGTPSSPSQGSSCGQCGGSGSMRCSTCGGRGSWYDAPQTATGTATLATCSACVSSGHIRCPYCGGSGRMA